MHCRILLAVVAVVAIAQIARADSPSVTAVLCNSTVTTTVTNELLKKAVTMGGSARAIRAIPITANNAGMIREFMRFAVQIKTIKTNQSLYKLSFRLS